MVRINRGILTKVRVSATARDEKTRVSQSFFTCRTQKILAHKPNGALVFCSRIALCQKTHAGRGFLIRAMPPHRALVPSILPVQHKSPVFQAQVDDFVLFWHTKAVVVTLES
jgi:hypothetical protein